MTPGAGLFELRSARCPYRHVRAVWADLCGGCRATGIPTAICKLGRRLGHRSSPAGQDISRPIEGMRRGFRLPGEPRPERTVPGKDPNAPGKRGNGRLRQIRTGYGCVRQGQGPGFRSVAVRIPDIAKSLAVLFCPLPESTPTCERSSSRSEPRSCATGATSRSRCRGCHSS